MIELRPLLEEDATEIEKALLLAGRSDGPRKEATTRVLAMMQASPPALGLQDIGDAGPAALVRPPGPVRWAKALLFAVAVCGATAVTYYLARSPGTVPSAVPVIPKTAPVAAPGEAPAPDEVAVSPKIHEGLATTREDQSSVVAGDGNAQRRRTMPSGRAREATRPASDSSLDGSLGEETRALDRARKALDAHRPSAVLRLLDGYHRRFPQGRLRPEAMVLRLAALVQAGRHGAAESLARQLLADEAYQTYATRIRSLLGETKP